MARLLIFMLCLGYLSVVYPNDCQTITLVNDFNKLVQHDRARDHIKMIILADSIISELERLGLNHCEVYFYSKYYKAHGHELKSEYEKAIIIYHNLIPEINKNRYKRVAAEVYLSLARVYETIGRPVDCLRNLENAFTLIKKNKLEDILSRYAVRYASYQRIYKDRNVALVYAMEAINLGEKHGIIRSITDGHLLAGMLISDLDSASVHIIKAEQLFFNDKAYLVAAAMALNRANKRIVVKEFDIAKKAIVQAEYYLAQEVRKKPEFYNGWARLYRYKQEIAIAENNIDSAYYFLSESVKYKNLSKYDINYKEISELEIKFAIEQEKIISDNYKRHIKTLLMGLSLLFVMLSILVWLYFNLKSKKKQIELQSLALSRSNNQLIDSNRETELLLSEVHHRVKNNLQVVISLLHMYSSKVEDKSLKNHLEMVSEKVMSISLIHEQLYNNENFSEVNMNAYFEELKIRYEQLYSSNTFEIIVDCEDIHFNLDTILPIGIITTELINNTIKYGKNNDGTIKISIALNVNSSGYSFVYRDNGPGYPEEKYHSTAEGIGSLLINSMVRQLLARNNSYNQNGAVFEMNFKEKITSVV